MYYSTIHTHTTYCDGKNTAEEMILAAINCNMKSIGISSHAPLPVKSIFGIDSDKTEKYIDEVNQLKNKYEDKIDVLLGMEIDYFINSKFNHVPKELVEKLDYFIGSIHFLGKNENNGKLPWTVDASYEEFKQGINSDFEGSNQKAISSYYYYLGEMVKEYKPTVLGHMDLVKKLNKNNILFDENDQWYKKAVKDCLDEVAKTNTVVEINTGAIAKGYASVQYPSDWILDEIKDRNISITINSDAHYKEHVNYAFHDMYRLVKEKNMPSIVYLTKDGWKNMNI